MSVLRGIFAMVRKNLQVARRRPFSTIITILLPMNVFILMILFALSGGLAPTAVVMYDQGPYAMAFVKAMRQANSFIIQNATASQADSLITQGKIVAVVTIPADFDSRVDAGENVTIPVRINNLNVDFTNDIRRGMSLALTNFYNSNFPNQGSVQIQELDSQSQDTGYIPYLGVSILVIGLLVGSLIQSGQSVSEYWDKSTFKEIFLAPIPRWAILVGELIGNMIIPTIGGLILLAFIIAVPQVVPVNPGELAVGFVLAVLIFVALGQLIGLAVKTFRFVIPLAFGLGFLLFFISGPFGPVDLGDPVSALIARISPAFYEIGLFQHAFHNLSVVPYPVSTMISVLLVYTVVILTVSTLFFRRTTSAR
jgi:ABC-2 type transport system permease protein